MATVTFDPAYFQELTKNLAGVSTSLNNAKTRLKEVHVGLDSGLVAFALCSKLNDDIKKINTTADGSINKASVFSKILINGSTRVDSWEANAKSRESSLASQLGKTWKFEDRNFTQETGQTAAGESSMQPGSSEDFALAGKDMNSKYYTQVMPGVPRTLINDYDKQEHMNCVYYARARAMEANGLDSYAVKGSGSEIQSNSIAHFPGHDVFIEEVKRGADGQPTSVVFSESNWGGTVDGHQQEISYDKFIKRGGSSVNKYTYF